jgi:NAD-dependent SIR2 family protein deacetylase
MNIDGVEARVLPPQSVRYVHGRIDDAFRCGRRRLTASSMLDIVRHDGLPHFNAENHCYVRPGFVMYGESVRHLQELDRDLRQADLVLCLGTRLTVEPIASFVRAHEHKVLCINAERVRGLKTIVGLCEEVCAKL